MEDKWAGWGSFLASAMFLLAILQQHFSAALGDRLARHLSGLLSRLHPYVEITFSEHSGNNLRPSPAYAAVESYLSASPSLRTARRLKANSDDNSSVSLAIDDHESVADSFAGAKLYWSSETLSTKPSFSFHPTPADRRSYRLSFHRRHRSLVTESYLRHVLDAGRDVALRNRSRRLYTNVSNDGYDGGKRGWSHVHFEHPATFETIAMDPGRKREIVEDLVAFSKGKEFYARIGKPWRRGYLLHGPPGTGKSTMIAAMANLLDYDVYDLELTVVKNNSALRKLLLGIEGKAIIVLEDIDCSLDLSGKRKKRDDETPEEIEKKMMGGEENVESKVTLSGLLNFVDGLWSACGGEKIVVFTTNHVEKLDPALIRRGRMDRHIELSYCDYEGFKVLAWNYLRIKEDALFGEVRRLMEERDITPADVAENLMPRRASEVEGRAEDCLRSLIQALKECKLKLGKGGEEEKEEDGEEKMEGE